MYDKILVVSSLLYNKKINAMAKPENRSAIIIIGTWLFS